MRCDENGFTDATQGAQWDEQRGARAAGAVAGDDHAVGDDGTDVHGAVPLPLGGGGVHDGQDSVAELWLAVRACTSRSKAGWHTDVGAFAIAAETKTVPQERRRRESAPWDIGLRSHREGGGTHSRLLGRAARRKEPAPCRRRRWTAGRSAGWGSCRMRCSCPRDRSRGRWKNRPRIQWSPASGLRTVSSVARHI